MSEIERRRSGRTRWCRITFEGKTGWVAGRFLKEGAGTAAGQGEAAAIGGWNVRCNPGCALEQAGVGATRGTVLRIEPREAGNAQISILRPGIATDGTLTIYMDGQTISQGPIAPLAGNSADELVMPPDDITAGLLRQMRTHRNMVLSLPGEERGVEIRLDRFDEAWTSALRQRN